MQRSRELNLISVQLFISLSKKFVKKYFSEDSGQ